MMKSFPDFFSESVPNKFLKNNQIERKKKYPLTPTKKISISSSILKCISRLKVLKNAIETTIHYEKGVEENEHDSLNSSVLEDFILMSDDEVTEAKKRRKSNKINQLEFDYIDKLEEIIDLMIQIIKYQYCSVTNQNSSQNVEKELNRILNKLQQKQNRRGKEMKFDEDCSKEVKKLVLMRRKCKLIHSSITILSNLSVVNLSRAESVVFLVSEIREIYQNHSSRVNTFYKKFVSEENHKSVMKNTSFLFF